MGSQREREEFDVGVVGLGHMGLPLALRLLNAGFKVAGNRRRDPPTAFLDGGGHGCSTPADLADLCPIVITVMPTANALVSAATGVTGLGSTTRHDGIWIEMSTVPATTKRSLANEMGEKGWHTLDCPISGAPDQLVSGQAVLLCSGSRETHDRAASVLQAISPRVSFMGAFGNGMRAKDTAHLLLAGHSLVAAEALAFASKAGLDIGKVLAALNGTIISSGVFDHRAHQVLDPPRTTGPDGVRGLRNALVELRRFAAELATPTPVLDQALEHLDSPCAGRTDELIVAFYQRLMSATGEDSPRGDEQN